MDTTQPENLLIRLAEADPADAPETAEELAEMLGEHLENETARPDRPGPGS